MSLLMPAILLILPLYFANCGPLEQGKVHQIISGGIYSGPYFDQDRNSQRVIATTGRDAYLDCFIKQLGPKSVSWLRKSDSHILSVDKYTFISDDRFQVLQIGESWTLHLKNVQKSDADSYECQISSSPKKAYLVQLIVLEPNIWIDTTEENILVWEGSQVQLKCVIENVLGSSGELRSLIWSRNSATLTKAELQHFIFQQTKEGELVWSETIIFPAVSKDLQGNYTCGIPELGLSSSVSLHILNGENPAELSRKGGSISSTASSPFEKCPKIVFVIIIPLIRAYFAKNLYNFFSKSLSLL